MCLCLIFEKKSLLLTLEIQEHMSSIQEIEQLTQDHSFVNHLVMTGQITEEEAFHHPQKYYYV